MSKKYIQEYQNNNFVYPNNDPWEYGVDIIHDINNNSVSGTVSNFVCTRSGTTGLTISFNWTWASNGAELFIGPTDYVHLMSVHMMTNQQTFFKPWRLIEQYRDTTPGDRPTTWSAATGNINLTPALVQQTTFTAGTYYFEIRMIGKREVFPICVTISVA